MVLNIFPNRTFDESYLCDFSSQYRLAHQPGSELRLGLVKSLRSAPDYFSHLVFILSVFLFSLLQAAYISAQEKPSAAHKLEPVTLGLSAKHVLNLPIYLAQRYGIFESEGFDLKPITTKTSTAIAALVSGDLDYITAFNSGLGAAVGGAPLVATYVSTDKPLLYLISRPDIKDAKGLRGGLIGHGGARQPLSRDRGDGEVSRFGRGEGR